jgi:hypothetical protein
VGRRNEKWTIGQLKTEITRSQIGLARLSVPHSFVEFERSIQAVAYGVRWVGVAQRRGERNGRMDDPTSQNRNYKISNWTRLLRSSGKALWNQVDLQVSHRQGMSLGQERMIEGSPNAHWLGSQSNKIHRSTHLGVEHYLYCTNPQTASRSQRSDMHPHPRHLAKRTRDKHPARYLAVQNVHRAALIRTGGTSGTLASTSISLELTVLFLNV